MALTASVGVGLLASLGGWAPLIIVTAAAGVAFVAFRMVTHPKFAVSVFLLYLPIDWLIDLEFDSVGHPEARLLRDAVLFAVVGSWAVWRLQQANGRSQLPLSVIVAMTAVAVISVVELANPGLHDWATAAVGIRTRLIPLLMVLVGFDLARTRGFVTAVNNAMFIVVVISGVVVILQLFRGDTLASAIDPRLVYPLAGVGANGLSVSRFPGPFLGAGLSMFLIIAFIVGMASFTKVRTRWHLALWLLAAGFWAVALLANNQRSLFLFLLIDAPIVVILGMRERRRLLLALCGIAVLPSLALAGTAGSARLFTLTSDPYETVIQQHLIEPFVGRVFPTIVEAPLGHGLGTYAPGVRYLLDSPNALTTPESYMAALVLESGVLGLLAHAFLLLVFAWSLVRAIQRSSDSYARVFATATLAVLIWVLQLSPTYEPLSYYPFAQLFWFCCGMAIGLVATTSVTSRVKQSRPSEIGMLPSTT